jgi:hypothetical protein
VGTVTLELLLTKESLMGIFAINIYVFREHDFIIQGAEGTTVEGES